MFPSPGGASGDRTEEVVRSGYDHDVHIGIGDRLFPIGAEGASRRGLCESGGTFPHSVARHNEPSRPQRASPLLSNQAAADDGNSSSVHLS
jgi:hypothetical protein